MVSFSGLTTIAAGSLVGAILGLIGGGGLLSRSRAFSFTGSASASSVAVGALFNLLAHARSGNVRWPCDRHGADMSVFLSVYHRRHGPVLSRQSQERRQAEERPRPRGNVHLRAILVGAASPRPEPRAAISRTSSTASRPAAAPCAQRSPSRTKSSSPPITCRQKLTLSRPRRSLSLDGRRSGFLDDESSYSKHSYV